MNIQRLRRDSVHDNEQLCDYCDESAVPGYRFGGEHVQGPRGGSLTVCDKCLAKTRKSPIGFLNEGVPERTCDRCKEKMRGTRLRDGTPTYQCRCTDRLNRAFKVVL